MKVFIKQSNVAHKEIIKDLTELEIKISLKTCKTENLFLTGFQRP